MKLLAHTLHFLATTGSGWVHALVILSAFFEGLPIIGYFSPGGILAAFGGFLVRTHVMRSLPIFLLAAVGAFLGDIAGYFIGRKYGFAFIEKYGRYFFFRKDDLVDRTKELIKTNPGKSIFLGRLNYLTRSISPFLAGYSDIPFLTFVLFDLAGSFAWAFLHIMVGYIFGQGFVAAARYLNYVMIGAIILGVIIFYVYRILNEQRHVFKKYHLYTLILNISSLYLFAKVAESVLDKRRWYFFDRLVHMRIEHLWSPLGIRIMECFTYLGSPWVAIPAFAVLLIVLLVRSRWYYASLVTLSVLSGELSELAIKSITHIARPSHALVATEFWSFPSGHAITATLLFGLIFHCFRRDVKDSLNRKLFFVLTVVLVALVGFSRIYLNAHWTSDVVAGISLGVFWVTFYILLLRAVMLTETKLLHSIRMSFANFFRRG